MKKSTFKALFFCLAVSLLSVSLFFSSCQKFFSDDKVYSPINSIDLSTKIVSSVSGFVTDENNLPVLNAHVQVGNLTISTDKYGYFEAKNAEVIKDAATVTVINPGYFKAIKTYMAADGKPVFFRIKLIPKTIAGTVNGGTGGLLTLSNGLAISLPANSVINASTNISYTGTVNIAAYWIDPTSSDLSLIMPGDLRGLNSNNKIQLLTTYGMAAIELTGSGGELLQIADGKKAILSLPIPFSIAASAPNTIPLWYMDESTGLWKEQGQATKTGNKYIGEVSHFSFWNCDVPNSYVQFNCTVVTGGQTIINSQPVVNALVKISVVNDPANFRYGYTNSAGYVSGAVPNNTQLLLEVFASSSCSTPAYSQTFTTTNVNMSLGTITISNAAALANVSGTVTTCNNMPVTNGIIIMKAGIQNYCYNLINGAFSFTTILCSSPSTITIVAEDLTNLQLSNPVNFTINAGNNAVGNIQACGTTPQKYMYYTVNSTPYHFITPPDSLQTIFTGVPFRYYIDGVSHTANNYNLASLFFEGTNIALGSLQPLLAFRSLQVPATQTISNPIFVRITEYGNIGQYVAGNFSGIITGPPPTNTAYNITCNFRVPRIF